MRFVFGERYSAKESVLLRTKLVVTAAIVSLRAFAAAADEGRVPVVDEQGKGAAPIATQKRRGGRQQPRAQ